MNNKTLSVKAVVFDFNGTLFWDTQIHNKAWDIFLEKKGIRLTDQEKFNKMHGKFNRDILAGIFDMSLSETDNLTFIAEKEGLYQELCILTDMQLAPGATEFLDFLMSRKIPFTIATASEQENIDFYFEHLKLERFFERPKVIYNDGSLLSKPHPQIFQKAIARLDAREKETLVFEDSIAGIQSAENACVGKIIIVDSNNDDYSRWNFQQIRNFSEVDKTIFEGDINQ